MMERGAMNLALPFVPNPASKSNSSSCRPISSMCRGARFTLALCGMCFKISGLNLLNCAKIFGWAVAYYAGGGLLSAIFSAVALLGWLLTPEACLWLILGFPLLFAFVAVYHGCTGKWPRTNYYFRQTSLTVLWALAFYLGYFVLYGLLIFFGVPLGLGEPLLPLIFFSPLAGGWAGSLCWRGRLPGTRKQPKPETPPVD